MRRTDLTLPWPGVSARIADISTLMGGEDSRLTPQMRRVHQSRSARALALELLDELGIHADRIGKGPVGEPVWPEGVRGSLSHTGHYAAATVAGSDACEGLGIDIEPALPLPGETDGVILCEEEQAWVAAVDQGEPAAGRLIFCAKECVHKSLYPLKQTWLEFNEVRIRFDESRECFEPEPVSRAAESALEGLQATGRVWRKYGQYIVILRLARPVC